MESFALKGIEEHFALGRVGDRHTCPTCHRTYALLPRRGDSPVPLWTDVTGDDDPPAPSITCPLCQATSYNPHDIREGYCGACHRFHDETRP